MSLTWAELLGDEATAADEPERTGLFHVAWLHPSRATLAETVRRVAGAGWPIDGAADHGVSEALYVAAGVWVVLLAGVLAVPAVRNFTSNPALAAPVEGSPQQSGG